MPHLDPERLAALDHVPGTADELAHLAQCVACRRERDAYARLATLARADGEVLSTVAVSRPRLTRWDALAAALRADGLLTRPSPDLEEPIAASSIAALPGGSSPGASEVAARRVPTDAPWTAAVAPRRPDLVATDGVATDAVATDGVATARSRRLRTPVRWATLARRAAAALALFVSGAAAGRLTSTAELAVPATDAIVALADGETIGVPASAIEAYGSVEEATVALERAQREYERASLWLASHDTTVNAQSVYRARLAALEQMLQASRAGLFEAPQDPVLNQYYLAAYAAREATLRQLGESLPVDRVMESF